MHAQGARLVAPVGAREGPAVGVRELRRVHAPDGRHAALAHRRKTLPALAPAHLHAASSMGKVKPRLGMSKIDCNLGYAQPYAN